MVLYENKNYKVVYDEKGDYQVINKLSGAVEEYHALYPKALTSAHIYNDSIERFFAARKMEETAHNVVDIREPR